MKWYKRDPDAFKGGTVGLTLEEVGAYTLILDDLYSHDGTVPDDDRYLSRLLHCNPRTWRRLKSRLIEHGKIRSIGGRLTANRVTETLVEAMALSEHQRNAARKRWERDRKPSNPNGGAMPPGNASTTTKKKESFLLPRARATGGDNAGNTETAAPQQPAEKQGEEITAAELAHRWRDQG